MFAQEICYIIIIIEYRIEGKIACNNLINTGTSILYYTYNQSNVHKRPMVGAVTTESGKLLQWSIVLTEKNLEQVVAIGLKIL